MRVDKKELISKGDLSRIQLSNGKRFTFVFNFKSNLQGISFITHIQSLIKLK